MELLFRKVIGVLAVCTSHLTKRCPAAGDAVRVTVVPAGADVGLAIAVPIDA